MRHTISLSLLLAMFWLLNSGHYTWLILFLGLLSIVIVVWVTHVMDVVDHESQPWHLTARIPAYNLWLLKEVMVASLDVAKRIWTGAISPVVIEVKASQKTDMGKVIYANSITLTPGTVSINIQEDTITVHALTREGAKTLAQGEMDRRVSRLAG